MTTKCLENFIIILLAVIFSLVSFVISKYIYNKHGSAYIDEIFHVPQAQLYCRNQWTEWNPKITTLPGLYLISYLLLKPLEFIGHENVCSLFNLRLTNVIATGINFLLAFKISSLLKNNYKTKSSNVMLVLTAFNIAILPPLYFFTFLYYTDVWSVTFVLLLYYSHIKRKKFLASFASVVAVLMRQTNIIWVGLMILDECWNVLSSNSKRIQTQNYTYSKNVLKRFISDYFSFKKNSKNIFSLITNCLSETYHYVGVCLLFVSFVFINGSIVVGDKKAHTATFHPMQNLYFLDFVAFFGLPFFVIEGFSIIKKLNVFLFMLLTGFAAGLSEVNKLEHPYLLADNRHLAFYLWKRFFGHSFFRRALVPTYVCAGMILMRLLQKRCHFMFAVTLSLCTFLNLTPQYLFELRYFIIPYILYRLQFKPSKLVFVESLFLIVVNVSVVYLFLNRPFVWLSEPDAIQRIIW